jgi:hypothetical protein
MLQAAGHVSSSGRNSGREWFVTNLEFLETFARLLGCTIDEAEIPELG